MQRNNRKRRTYRSRRKRTYRVKTERRPDLFIVVAFLALALVAFGLIQLIHYVSDMSSSRQNTAELREIYNAVPTEIPTPVTAEQTDEIAALSEQTPSVTETPAIEPEATAPPAVLLASESYPDNPDLKINSRFKSLIKECKHIIGWLNIDRLIDEPVVQWNNVYYMDHDIKGKKNVNGTIFLDSTVEMKKRPNTYILYGHNMKTGAMFGNLRNYHSSFFYHNNPFITFETIYESNRYVIFAESTISIVPNHRNYLDLMGLASNNIRDRKTAIETIIAESEHTCTIDVKPEDQILLLVTCVGNDDERRIVAARCIRNGETEAQLKGLVGKSNLR